MSAFVDMKFSDRLKKAADRKRVEWGQTALGVFLGVKKQTAERWMGDGQPSIEMLFDIADRMEVNPRWLAGQAPDSEWLIKQSVPAGLAADEEDLIARFRDSDPRWQLTLRLLARIATEDQLAAATEMNMVVAKLFGKKPRELRPIGNKRMRGILRNSTQGWPPKAASVKTGSEK